jgi:hypothetical protein
VTGRDGNRYQHPGPAFKLAPTASLLEQDGIGLPARPVTCGQLWGGTCPVVLDGPGWSHGGHPDHCQQVLAASTARSPTVLLLLAASPDPVVQHAVASNRGAPAEVLRLLATHQWRSVQAKVAEHQNTPPDVLGQLGGSSELGTRLEVAGNPRTPAAVLAGLLRDPASTVRAAAAANPGLPRHVQAMWELAQGPAR